MASIRLSEVGKRYSGVHAVQGLDLEVRDGELLVLLGPSGCGKSTILRLIAGLESPDQGEIWLGDRRIDGEPPHQRNIAMVFQSYALYGHLTVRENLGFPLRMHGVPRVERSSRILEVARFLELEDLLDTKPGSLSGGQQQRVAMGRALVREPDAFLLDEPLSNLDVRLRSHVRTQIARIQARLGVTTLHVTHDQVEAMSLGDRIAILREGRLQQIGPGQDLYDRPKNTFVASFLGQPGMNLVHGHLEAEGGVQRIDLGPVSLPIPTGFQEHHWKKVSERDLIVGIRPESIRLAPDSVGEGRETLAGRVSVVEALGNESLLHVETALEAASPPESVFEAARDGSKFLLAVRVPRRRNRLHVGDSVRLSLKEEGLHLFSRAGRALTRRRESKTIRSGAS